MAEKRFFGEGRNIEFKREIPKKREKFLKDIIAFSNCTGGKVILGIEDITNVVYGIGEVNPFKLSDDISNMISDACTPQISPDITVRTLDGKTVLVIDVAPGRFRPYYLKSVGKEASAYIRINGTSRPADIRRLQELELEGQRIYYDTLQEIGMEYDENAAEKLCASMKEIALSACRTEEEKAEIPDMTVAKLEDMGLLCMVGREYAPTHAFNLMTVNKIKYAKIQCALFKGLNRDIFIDRREYKGPIYEQIEEAYQFVKRHINLGAEINGIVRRDVYELPIRAIREAIINGVTHRSYMDDSCMQISIYDDRVEVYSPGMLYGGLDISEALSGKSKCRNAAISEAFHYMKIVEAWGTGLGRIRNSCREYGLREPVIEESGDGFHVIFYRKTMGMADLENIGCSYDFMVQTGNVLTVNEASSKMQYTTGNVLKDTAKDVTKDALGDVIKDASEDVTKGALEDVTKDALEDVTKDASENVTKGVSENATKDAPEDVTKDDSEDVIKDNVLEMKILSLIKVNDFITTTEMAERLSVTRRTVQRGLAVLKNKGLIERKGGRRYGYWEVSRDIESAIDVSN